MEHRSHFLPPSWILQTWNWLAYHSFAIQLASNKMRHAMRKIKEILCKKERTSKTISTAIEVKLRCIRLFLYLMLKWKISWLPLLFLWGTESGWTKSRLHRGGVWFHRPTFGNEKVTVCLYVNNHSLLFSVFGCSFHSIPLHWEKPIIENSRSTGIGLGLHSVGVGKTEPLRTEVIPTYAKQGSTGIPIGRSCFQLNIFMELFHNKWTFARNWS